MRRGRFEDDFMDDMHEMHRHRHMGIFSLIPMTIGLAMTFVNIGLRIAQSVTNVVFSVLFGVTRQVGNTKNWNSTPNRDFNTEAPRPEPPRAHRKEAKAEPQPRVINLEEERAKQQTKTAPPEVKPSASNKKNWNILVFLFSLIISVTVLCTGRLLEAAAIFAGGFVLMGFVSLVSSIKNRKQKVKPIKQEVCKDEEVEKLLKAAEAKIADIRKSKLNVMKYDMQLKIEDLCQSGDKIIKTVRTTPEDLTLVRKFFYYYVDSLGEVTQRYIKISTSGVYDKEISELMVETEKAFDDFKEIFTDYEKKLLEKDLMNLKAEINVIKNES